MSLQKDQFWGITTYFNPSGYKSKYENYQKFRESNKKQGLNLITVECAFGNKEFKLSQNDADIIVQIRCDSVLWQKERLLNVGLQHLPKECSKVAWLDADIIFLNDNWIIDTIEALDNYKIIQLFDTVVRLKKNQKFITGDDFQYGAHDGAKRPGYIYNTYFSGDKTDFYAPGYAWAIRREIIDKIKFYDKLILGGGDGVLMAGFCGPETHYQKLHGNTILQKDAKKWIEESYSIVGGNVGYINGLLLHLFHGEVKNRNYMFRYKLIEKYQFDPNKDIQISGEGCWEWNTNNINLKNAVKEYFHTRNEDEKRGGLSKYVVFLLFLRCKKYTKTAFNLRILYIRKKIPGLYCLMQNMYRKIFK